MHVVSRIGEGLGGYRVEDAMAQVLSSQGTSASGFTISEDEEVEEAVQPVHPTQMLGDDDDDEYPVYEFFEAPTPRGVSPPSGYEHYDEETYYWDSHAFWHQEDDDLSYSYPLTPEGCRPISDDVIGSGGE